MVKFDGQYYDNPNDVPDLGSIVCVEARDAVRTYSGLLEDIDKLPMYVGAGSTAMLTNGDGTTEVYSFLDGEWVKL